MNRKKLFAEMLKQAKEQNFGYIGKGNIEAKILVIGKEAATNETDTLTMDEYRNNLAQWERDIDKDLWDIPLRNRSKYSPVCPYKGQYAKLNNNKNNWGTSRTWLIYQKLHNYIFGSSYDRINFHKNFFITEINDNPSSKTKDAKTDNLALRKDFIKNSGYFQDFPVVILAGLEHYCISETHNDIEDMFGVKFTGKKVVDDKEKQCYWVHWGKDKTKLVINTRQLSMNISDNLLIEIASLITSLEIDFTEEETDKNELTKKRWENGGKEIYEKYQEIGEEFANSDEYKDYMTWVRTGISGLGSLFSSD